MYKKKQLDKQTKKTTMLSKKLSPCFTLLLEVTNSTDSTIRGPLSTGLTNTHQQPRFYGYNNTLTDRKIERVSMKEVQ